MGIADLRNVPKHFAKICVHKFHVAKYCWHAGLYKQALTHDISKFSPTEFVESVHYYQGNRSPILAAKDDKGYSVAWQHHKGRNRHHYEYWQDNFDHGGKPIKMPLRFALELVCDYLGAGEAYMGDDFTYEKEYEWWMDKKNKPIAMHPQTLMFVDEMLKTVVATNSIDCLHKDNARKVYYDCKRKWLEQESSAAEPIGENTDEL